MNHSDFTIGSIFYCGDGTWRCTDRGTRTVIAIRIDQIETTGSSERRQILSRSQAEREGWFNGPPYAVAEMVFDEYDLPACSPTEKVF